MATQWFRDACPECSADNWVCDGDPQDLTAMDTVGIRCWKCGREWMLGDDDLDSDEFDGDDCEDGREFREVAHGK